MTQLQEQSNSSENRMKWYKEAKFGLFIHWGPYSVAGVEASWPIMAPVLSAAMFGTELSITEEEYTALPAQFNPVDFDPDQWVRLAQDAGMRYIIFTSKHHDGFCMFDAPGTDYKITNTPYGKDICLELSHACVRAGMPLGFYYSPPDMHHPGYRDTTQPITKNWTGQPKRKEWGEYLDYMESHIRKLLTDYGKVSVIWFDGLTNHGKYNPKRFHQLVHELSPETLINDRLGDGYDFITPEQFIPKAGIPAITGKPNPSMDPAGDLFFRTVSSLSTIPVIRGWLIKQVHKYRDGTSPLTKVYQEPYPRPERFQPWETCMTMGDSWAYNPSEQNWKDPCQLVRNLVDVVSHGGNYLLNVGPTSRGVFPKEAIERIEVVRGPSSAMYGSEGMGGVIHIITKKPDPERKSSIRAEAGTSDTWAGRGFHSQTVDRFGLLVAGGYEESDGFYMKENPKDYEIKRYREAGKVLGKVSYDLDDQSNLTGSALYYDHETGKSREFFYDELQLGQYAVNYSRTTAAGFGLKALAYYNQADKTAYQDTARDNFATLFRYEEAPSENWGTDLQGSLLLGKSAILTVGATYREISWDYDNNYIGSDRDEGAEGTQRFVSPFFNADLKFLEDRLILNLGARYDWMETTDGKNWDSSPGGGKEPYDRSYDDESNSSFSPKVGITAHPDERTTLRASAGKGFRAPSLFELFKVHVRGGGTYYREANPDLDPEEIWSWDVGAERALLDNLRAGITYYESYAEDYIGTRTTKTYEKNGKIYKEYVYGNISEVEMHGIEAELNWYPLADVMIFGNYTWNVSEITKNEENPFEEGLYLTNDPRHKFHAGATYQNPKIINVTVLWNRYLDKYYSVDETTQAKDDFWSLDLAVSRRFFDYVTAYVNVENVFDSVDNESIAPGTIYTGGVKFEF